MTYRYTSTDGLLSSNDPDAVAFWDRRIEEEKRSCEDWTARLREMGVKMAHPDDGWVSEPGRGYHPNNPRKWLHPCYPQFDDHPQVGDLIALGWPREGYRLVRVIEVVRKKSASVLSALGWVDYYYEDDGATIGKPVPQPTPRRSRWWSRLLHRSKPA